MKRVALLLASCVLGAGALSASAATQQNPLVRPGRSIGNVSLGMTVAQVRKAVGRPEQVERQRLTGNRFHVRYVYEVAQISVEFVGTRASFGRPAIKARVTRIATTSDRARLRNGIGVGTREKQLIRAFRERLDCPRWQRSELTKEGGRSGTGIVAISMVRPCYLRGPGNALTVFVSRIKPPGYRGFGIPKPSDIPSARVWEIIVRRAA